MAIEITDEQWEQLMAKVEEPLPEIIRKLTAVMEKGKRNLRLLELEKEQND